MNKLTVSIVTYNTDIEELKLCLESLQSGVVSKIYIIDNSRRAYIEEFCKGKDKIEYIGSENVGYGAGHNQALRRLVEEKESDYHLVLNSDVRFEPDVLSELLKYMTDNPDVGQVQPKIVYPNGSLQYTVRLLPSPIDLIFRRFLPDWFTKKRNYRYLLKFADHEKEMNVPYHQGSFMLFRNDAVLKVGFFDERFFMYPEDIDITRRIHQHYRTMYYPRVSVIHDHRAASYKSGRMLKIHIKNMIKYFNKWGWIFDAERKKFNKKLLQSIK